MADFIMPVGPQSPSLKEPVLLKLQLDGDHIQGVDMQLGYTHKGVEKLMEGKNPDNALYLAQRICGICSMSHESAYMRAVESAMGITAPERVDYLRTLLFEMERMTSHMLWAGFAMHEIGLDTMFQYFWREREKLLDLFERITGGRIHHNISKIGTMRFDLPENSEPAILGTMDLLEKSITSYKRECERSDIIRHRFRGVGIITNDIAKSWGLTGPNARASGVDIDIRKLDPYQAYGKISFETKVRKTGDAYDRLMLRLEETLESIKIIRTVMKKMPSGPIPPFNLHSIAGAEGIGRVEAPRGELFYYIRFKDNQIERVKMRTPTLGYIKLLETLLPGHKIADVPVIVASLDPCFSCLERVMVAKHGVVETLAEDDFRRKYKC